MRDTSRKQASSAVRRAELGRILTGMSWEQGDRTISVVSKFHDKVLDPRFERLEKLPWNRLGLFVWDLAVWIFNFVTRRNLLPYKKGQRVKTTDIGEQSFHGPQTGVVTGVRSDMVRVQRDGEREPEEGKKGYWVSASVWRDEEAEVEVEERPPNDPQTRVE